MEGAALLSRAALKVLSVDQTASLTYLRGRDGARRVHLLSPRSGAQRLSLAGEGAGPEGRGRGGGGAGEGLPRPSPCRNRRRVGGPASFRRGRNGEPLGHWGALVWGGAGKLGCLGPEGHLKSPPSGNLAQVPWRK